jgi:drug/metabolite transporter (DMT)-like permease
MMKMMKVNKSHLVPFAILLFSAAIYSMTLSLNRIAITEGIPVFAFVFWQCLGAALLTFVAAVATRQLPSLQRKDFRLYLLLGTFGTAVPITLIVFVAPKVPAGAIALGLTLVPILTYGIAVLFRIDRIRLLRIAGFLFGLAGVLLVLLPDQSLPEPGMAPWLLMAFGAPLCWAFCNVCIAILRPPESRPIPLTCGVFACASITMLPVMAVTENWWIFDATMTDGDWALIGTIVIIPIVYALTFVLIQMLGPVLFSTIGYFGTLMGLGWAALYFGEVPSPWIWAAIAILFFGLFLVNRTSKPSSI